MARDSLLSERNQRDRGEERRKAFLDAARTVFLAQGYEAASMTEVVRIAGGSLATLYAQFGNKEGLFLAMASERQAHFLHAITPTQIGDLSLESGLRSIGEHFLKALLAPDAVAMFRVVLGEGRNLPPELRRFFLSGGDRARAIVAEFLRGHGVDPGDDSRNAAFFLDLVRSRHHTRALAEPDFKLTAAELSAHVAAATQLFLNGAMR